MKRRVEKEEEEPVPVFYSAQPPGFLPSFAHIRKLSRMQQRVPLEAWVAWVNANRSSMNPALERQLDVALGELAAVCVPRSEFDRLGRRFDEWLDSVEEVDAS